MAGIDGLVLSGEKVNLRNNDDIKNSVKKAKAGIKQDAEKALIKLGLKEPLKSGRNGIVAII